MRRALTNNKFILSDKSFHVVKHPDRQRHKDAHDVARAGYQYVFAFMGYGDHGSILSLWVIATSFFVGGSPTLTGSVTPSQSTRSA